MADEDTTFDALRAIEAKAAGLNTEEVVETPEVEEQAAETPVEETAPAAEEVEPSLILGKYKTTEDALAALEESQSHIGRLGNDNGQLRRELEELRQSVQQQQLPRQQEELDSLILEDPAQAAERALEIGDNYRFQQAVEQWNAVSPGAPKLWWDNKQLQQQFHELSERVGQQTAPALNLAVQAEQRQALDNMAARHEDFGQVVSILQDESRLAELVQAGFPARLLEGLDQPGTLPQREEMLATLYAFGKAQQAGLLPQAVAAAAEQVRNETVDAKKAATVPAASAGSPETKEPDGVTMFKDAFRQNFGLPRLIDAD